MAEPIPLRPRRGAASPVTEVGYAASKSWWDLDVEETPELRWPHSIEVFDRMRRQDAQVVSVMKAVTLPVLQTAWRLDPAGARDEVAEHVAEDLGLRVKGQEESAPPPRTRGRFAWGEHLHDALLMCAFGHMFFEQVYRLDDAGRLRLRKLAPRWPRTIAKINVAADGGLESVEQHPPAGGTTLRNVELPVDRLVAYVNDREGANWLGTSLLRPAYKHWLLKDRLLRTWTQTIDRNGVGLPVYTGAAPEEDLAKGEEIAKSVRAGDSSGAAIPNGASLVLAGVSGDLPDAEKAVRYHDEQIARSVLAHFLNLGTQTGSWALGSTFADFFVMSLQNLAQTVADTATQHVVEDLVDLNFGPDEPAPRVTFDPVGQNAAAIVQAVQMLIGAGAIFPDPALDGFVRDLVGLPPKAPFTPTSGS